MGLRPTEVDENGLGGGAGGFRLPISEPRPSPADLQAQGSRRRWPRSIVFQQGGTLARGVTYRLPNGRGL
jgi:hypothetical protein